MGIECRSRSGYGGEMAWLILEGAVGSGSASCWGAVESLVWDLTSGNWSARTQVQDRDLPSSGRGLTGWAVTESTVRSFRL
jgi:hypothetical protein